MQVGFKSDKGKKRFNNEDACFVMLHNRLYVVADGVGGSNAGEVASRMAVTETANYFIDHSIEECGNDDEINAYFEDCVKHVNNTIYHKSQKNTENRGMATTLVFAYANKGSVYIANIGDSRAYLYRNKKLIQVTEDHTYVNELVQAGLISKTGAENHKEKHKITRAVGAEEEVKADMFKVDVQLGDKILICTDGLYGEVNEKSIGKILDKDKTMSETCEELVNQANINGGHDNITVICLKVMEEDINE